jgi:hypothetical protein
VFDWLFEGRTSVYVSLAAAAIVMLLAWQQTRKRFCLIGLAAAVGLAGLYFLLDRLVETDREQVERKVQEMAAGVRARDVNAIFNHVSERFSHNGMGRAQFRQSVEGLLQGGIVDDIEVWEFTFPEDFRAPVSLPGQETPAETIRFSFRAKPKGGRVINPLDHPCEARFVRDPDGQWRMLDFQVFNPVLTNQPEQIPVLQP